MLFPFSKYDKLSLKNCVRKICYDITQKPIKDVAVKINKKELFLKISKDQV